MRKRLPYLLLLAVPLLLWKACGAYDANRFGGIGIVAPDPPEQWDTDVAPFWHQGVQIEPMANFSATARVLSAKHYSGERDGEAVPVDLALGWGEMSDWAVLKEVTVGQRHRYYNWRVKDWILPREVIETSSANMHFVPADAAIQDRLEDAGRGDVIRFSGYLIQIHGAEGPWSSSMTRDDVGARACEVVFLESFEIL